MSALDQYKHGDKHAEGCFLWMDRLFGASTISSNSQDDKDNLHQLLAYLKD